MKPKTTIQRGRPRNFDIDKALERALYMFWRNGFDSMPLSELTQAMEINKPSLYAAFGDKETLYLKTMERYVSTQLQRHFDLLEQEPEVRNAIKKFFRSLVVMFTDANLPGGCFLITGTANVGATGLPVRIAAALDAALTGGERKLEARLRRGQSEGQLPAHLLPDSHAAFLMSMVAGLSVMAKMGAGQEKLNRAIDSALQGWPV